jgi:arylsulfatase A-like enzyme
MPFPANAVTYATLLHAAGYYTGFIGKWHMGEQRERPGFDYSASFTGQGIYYNCPFLIDGGKQTIVSDKWVDDTSTDYAIDFLKQHKDQPFMLVIGFKSTHGPFKPNEPDRTLYQDQQARPVPNSTVEPSWRVPFDSRPFPEKSRNLVPYMECLTGADRDIGRLMDELDALGLTRDTMVIYSSDNGFDMGEHELGDKRSAYEESMRIPFIVRAPFIPHTAGKAVDQMVLNIDVAPTLLDFAGVPVPKTMQGRSLRPLLAKKSVTNWTRSFIYEYFFEKYYLWPTMVGVRTDDAKLVTYPNHPEWTELFQLDRDPYEINNLAGKPEAKALQARMGTELVRLQDTLAYVVPGDSDKDTYAEDAQWDMENRKQMPGYPPTRGNIVPEGSEGAAESPSSATHAAGKTEFNATPAFPRPSGD